MVACPQFQKVDICQFVVFQFFEDIDDIMDFVDRQATPRIVGSFSSREGPLDGLRSQMVLFRYPGENLGFMSVDRKEDFVLDKIHFDHPVYRRTFFADGTLDGCDFSGTLGDIKNTDLFFRYAFVDVFFPDIDGCNIHGLL